MRRTTSALTTTILGAVLSASTVSAQQSQPPDRLNGGASADADAGFGMAAARGARHLLRSGLDYIEYQEFDRALKYLREAEKRQAELNGPERTKLKQAIDRAQRGTREAIGSEKPYALSQRTLRSGGFAPAANSTAVADKARDRAVTREGDDRPEPIRLAGGEAPEPAPAASRARVAAAPAPLPEIPDAPPIEVPAAPKRSRWEMPSSAKAVADSALADAMKVPTAPKVVPIEPVAAAPKPVASDAADDASPAPAPERSSAAMQAQADLVTPFPTLDPAPAAAADSAVTRSRTAMTAAPEPTAEPAAGPAEPAPAPAAAPEPIRLELPDQLPDPAGLAGARTAPALHRDSTEKPAQDPAETPAAEAVPTPAEEPAPAPAAMPVPVDLGPAPAAETLSIPAEEPAPAATPTPAPAGMSDPMLDLPALPSELRGAAPAPQPSDGLPQLPGETDPAPAMPAPAQDLPQLPADEPTPAAAPAFTPVSDLGAAPSAAEAAGLNPQSPASTSGFVPPRSTASSTLSPDLERSVEAIARRQEEEDRARLARRQQPAIEPEAGYDPNRDLSADSRMQTQIDISRAPSPAEARPINAVPVPEDWVPLGARTWSPQRKYWAAAATCHLPLYFQDPMLERYGHSVEQYLGPAGRYFTYPVDNHKQSTQRMQILQPFASAGQFAFQILTLPYALVVDPPWEAQYDLGYWRPGDKIPTDMYYLPVHGTGPPLKGKNY